MNQQQAAALQQAAAQQQQAVQQQQHQAQQQQQAAAANAAAAFQADQQQRQQQAAALNALQQQQQRFPRPPQAVMVPASAAAMPVSSVALMAPLMRPTMTLAPALIHGGNMMRPPPMGLPPGKCLRVWALRKTLPATFFNPPVASRVLEKQLSCFLVSSCRWKFFSWYFLSISFQLPPLRPSPLTGCWR